MKSGGFAQASRHPWERARLELVSRLITRHAPLADGRCGARRRLRRHLRRRVARARLSAVRFYAVDSAFTPELIETFASRMTVRNVALFASMEAVPAGLPGVAGAADGRPRARRGRSRAFCEAWQPAGSVSAATRFLITVPAYGSLFCSHDRFLGHYRRYSFGEFGALLESARLVSMSAGHLFTSLVPLRILQVVRERLVPPSADAAQRAGHLARQCSRRARHVGRARTRRPALDGAAPARHPSSRPVQLRRMPDVCLVVPCYNEERRLPTPALLAFLDSHPHASLCLVDDGSRDGTLAVLRTLAAQRPDRVLVVAVSPNGGKAEAVRAGVRHAHAAGPWPFIGYWDADLSTPLSEVNHLHTALLANPECRIAMGSQGQTARLEHRPPHRAPRPWPDLRRLRRRDPRPLRLRLAVRREAVPARHGRGVLRASRSSRAGCSTSRCCCDCATRSASKG